MDLGKQNTRSRSDEVLNAATGVLQGRSGSRNYSSVVIAYRVFNCVGCRLTKYYTPLRDPSTMQNRRATLDLLVCGDNPTCNRTGKLEFLGQSSD